MSTAINNLDLQAKGLWFPLVVSILLLLAVLLTRKQGVNWKEIYITFGVVGFATWITDALISRTFNLIDLGDPQTLGIGEILSYTLIPTSLASLYLNFANKENRWNSTFLFSIISILIELGMEFFGYMKTQNWITIGSFLFFLFIYGFVLPYHIKLIRRN